MNVEHNPGFVAVESIDAQYQLGSNSGIGSEVLNLDGIVKPIFVRSIKSLIFVALGIEAIYSEIGWVYPASNSGLLIIRDF